MTTSISMLSEEDFRRWIREELMEAGHNTKPKSNDEEFLTREEVAKLLKKSIQTIDNYRRDGILRSYTKKGSVIFIKSEVYEDIRKNLTSS